MNENANTVQQVINTLQDLDIKATYDNMNILMGCLQTLASIRDKLNKPDKPANPEQNNENVHVEIIKPENNISL